MEAILMANEIEKTVKTSATIAKVSTFSGLRAISYLAIPLFELVLMAGVVYGIVSLPAKLLGLGGEE